MSVPRPAASPAAPRTGCSWTELLGALPRKCTCEGALLSLENRHLPVGLSPAPSFLSRLACLPPSGLGPGPRGSFPTTAGGTLPPRRDRAPTATHRRAACPGPGRAGGRPWCSTCGHRAPAGRRRRSGSTRPPKASSLRPLCGASGPSSCSSCSSPPQTRVPTSATGKLAQSAQGLGAREGRRGHRGCGHGGPSAWGLCGRRAAPHMACLGPQGPHSGRENTPEPGQAGPAHTLQLQAGRLRRPSILRKGPVS